MHRTAINKLTHRTGNNLHTYPEGSKKSTNSPTGLPLIYKTYSQDKLTLTGTADVSWAAALQFGQSPDWLNINNQNNDIIMI